MYWGKMSKRIIILKNFMNSSKRRKIEERRVKENSSDVNPKL